MLHNSYGTDCNYELIEGVMFKKRHIMENIRNVGMKKGSSAHWGSFFKNVILFKMIVIVFWRMQENPMSPASAPFIV